MTTIQTTWVGPNPFGITPKPKPKQVTFIGARIVIDASKHAREYRAQHGKTHGCWSGLCAQFTPGKTLELICEGSEATLLAAYAHKWSSRHNLNLSVTQQKTSSDGRGRVFLTTKEPA
jgi:hypothetical protein